jgi:hypothetical protein
MTKSWVPGSCNKCWKRPPSVSLQRTGRRTKLSNTSQHVGIEHCHKRFDSPGKKRMNMLQVSAQEKFRRSEIRRARRPFDPFSTSNLPSWMRHLQPLPDIFPHDAPKLRRTETTTSASQPDAPADQFPEKSSCPLAVIMSGSRQERPRRYQPKL